MNQRRMYTQTNHFCSVLKVSHHLNPLYSSNSVPTSLRFYVQNFLFISNKIYGILYFSSSLILTFIRKIQVKWSESNSVVSNSLRPHGLYSPWNSPGQNTGVGSLSLLQGIFPTQGSNLGLLHCRQILHQLSHQGSPGKYNPTLTRKKCYPCALGGWQNSTLGRCLWGNSLKNCYKRLPWWSSG